MSEHQLRVQRSLQRLNVPEWYRNSTLPAQGFLLKRNSDAGLQQQQQQGWQGLSNKTTSLSSLGSTQSAAPRSPTGQHFHINRRNSCLLIKLYYCRESNSSDRHFCLDCRDIFFDGVSSVSLPTHQTLKKCHDWRWPPQLKKKHLAQDLTELTMDWKPTTIILSIVKASKFF